MAEEVILSAIESLDYWMLRKGCVLDENTEKLYILIVGMLNLGKEKKEMVHSLLLQLRMEDEDEEGNEEGNENERAEVERMKKNEKAEVERMKKNLYNLLDLNKEKMDRLVVGMVDFWEDYKERLYHLLLRLSRRATSPFSLVLEIVDLWDDLSDLNKQKLYRFLFKMQLRDKDNCSQKYKRRMMKEMAGLWKDEQPKLNKEKLYTWLANKVDLCEPNYLFCVLLDAMLLYDSSYFNKGVKEVKRELGEIMYLITDKKLGDESSLRYFISDIVDMAHRTRFLIQLEDSDPFALFIAFSVLRQGFEHKTYHYWLGKKFKSIVNELQDTKVGMLGFRVERLQNVREMEGGETVVGLEDDVKLLLCNKKKIIVITGMAGIGKTTLARQVYNHTTITQHFKCRVWVRLSNMFSRKEMLVSLIRQMVDSSELEKMEHADYESLKQALHQRLQRRRYFIVLDNVLYKTTHYQYIMKALPKDKQGSRLLVTTRTVRGSDYYGSYGHHMKSMDEDTSWTLLLKVLSIEGSDKEFPKPLVKQARQILKKCGGLPLAIKEVGRNWAKKRQFGLGWEEIIESIDLTETLGALESTYQDWDRQLQSCFLHLAFFKEGTTIRAKRLVHIWVVLGVVSNINYRDNLFALSRESVIDIVIDRDVRDNIKTCCVHPVFHMLSIRLAEDELNFEIVHEEGNNRTSHHRVIYCSREKLMNYSSNQDKHLVSLFFYGGGYINARPSYWKHFEQLKTLDMEDFGLKILPDVIGILSELRYLGLRNNYIQELPYSLSCLKKLEVLDIALNFMVEVEDIIWEMESLRHLYMSDISCRKPLRINTLKNLETLTYVSVNNWEYDATRLDMMKSLTKLGIQEVDENTNLSTLFASLAKLKNLEFLILRGFRFKSMPSLDEIGILQNLQELKLDGLITRLPSAKNFPTCIRRLSLVNSCLHEDPMLILEKYFCLSYLKLQNAYTGQHMVISRNGFWGLKFLVIEELWHLTNMQIEEGAMKWLEELEINSCPNLETFPEGYCSKYAGMVFKMKTTKKNATKIRESNFVSKIGKVDIQP